MTDRTASTPTTPAPSPFQVAPYSPAKKPATCSFPNEPKTYANFMRSCARPIPAPEAPSSDCPKREEMRALEQFRRIHLNANVEMKERAEFQPTPRQNPQAPPPNRARLNETPSEE